MPNPKTTGGEKKTLASLIPGPSPARPKEQELLCSADIISLLSASRSRLTGAQARAANAFIRLAKILSQATSRAQNRLDQATKEIIFTRAERSEEIQGKQNTSRRHKSGHKKAEEPKKQPGNQIKCQQHGIEGRAKKSCRPPPDSLLSFSQVRAADFWLCLPISTFSNCPPFPTAPAECFRSR